MHNFEQKRKQRTSYQVVAAKAMLSALTGCQRDYVMGKKLGQGAFATVFRATVRGAPEDSEAYAIKRTTRRGLSEADRSDLLQEVGRVQFGKTAVVQNDTISLGLKTQNPSRVRVLSLLIFVRCDFISDRTPFHTFVFLPLARSSALPKAGRRRLLFFLLPVPSRCCVLPSLRSSPTSTTMTTTTTTCSKTMKTGAHPSRAGPPERGRVSPFLRRRSGLLLHGAGVHGGRRAVQSHRRQGAGKPVTNHRSDLFSDPLRNSKRKHSVQIAVKLSRRIGFPIFSLTRKECLEMLPVQKLGSLRPISVLVTKLETYLKTWTISGN